MTDKQYKTWRKQIKSMLDWIKDLTIIDVVSFVVAVVLGFYLGTLLLPFIRGKISISFADFVGGILAVIGILLLSKRTFNQDRQIQFQVDKEIDDRFTSAITLLGSEQTSARTGSLYVLYEFAISTEKYRKQVVQIMCAHIRGHTQTQDYSQENKAKPSDEIQTAINLLFKDMNGTKGIYYQDFASTLPQADLSYSYLVGAGFYKANLRNIVFHHTKLQNALFYWAQCQRVNFRFAECQGAHFSNAQCQGADFYKTQCQGADFRDAECQGAVFTEAKCQGAAFILTRCQGAVFLAAHCQGANFMAAQCQGANFSLAECQGANFGEVQCQGALFNDTQCHGAMAHEGIFLFVLYLSDRVGKPTELNNIVIAGGLEGDWLDKLQSLVEICGTEWFENMEKIHEEHRDKTAVCKQPKGIMTGVLEDTEEIQKIIAEIKKIRLSNE